jgi:hypothetical protein
MVMILFGIEQCIVGLIYIGFVFLFFVIGTTYYLVINSIKLLRELKEDIHRIKTNIKNNDVNNKNN